MVCVKCEVKEAKTVMRRTGQDPIPPDGGPRTRTCNIEDPSRETVTRYPSTPVLARYCHLPYIRTRVTSTFNVKRMRDTHCPVSQNPHVSPNSQSSQYRHASVRSHRLPHALGVTDNRHTRRDYVAKITGYGLPHWIGVPPPAADLHGQPTHLRSTPGSDAPRDLEMLV